MSGHSPIAPSDAYRWGSRNGCTGSIKMQSFGHTPKVAKDTTAANEGTCAHWLAELMLRIGVEGLLCGDRETLRPMIGTMQKGVLLSDEVWAMAELFADEVIDVMLPILKTGNAYYGIEQRVYCHSIYEGQFGTVDAFIYDMRTRTLIEWDFKTGRKYVDPFENWQCINYTSGILDGLHIHPDELGCEMVQIRIVSPRVYTKGGKVETWEVSVNRLHAEYFPILHSKALRAMGDGEPNLNTGSHCIDCKARHNCKPALEAGIKLFEVSSEVTPLDMSPEAKGVQLLYIEEAFKRLKSLKAAYEPMVENHLRKGDYVPTHKFKQSIGTLAWNDDAGYADILKLGKDAGADLNRPGTSTPTQAITAGVSKDAVAKLASRGAGSTKLATDNCVAATKLFTKGKTL